jgi:hypothetical protein
MLPLHNGTTVLHDDPWCGSCEEHTNLTPYNKYGGSEVRVAAQSYYPMALQWLDPELLKDKNFVLVYIAVETFLSKGKDIPFWRFNVAYQCSNPEHKKGSRGISETSAHLAYFSPQYANTNIQNASV